MCQYRVVAPPDLGENRINGAGSMESVQVSVPVETLSRMAGPDRKWQVF